MPPLNRKHHTLIQALLSRGPLMAKEFYELFEGVTGGNLGARQAILNDYLLKINKELSYVQFELRACMNQYDGQLYYGIVNNVADDQSKFGTKYTAPQIAFYKGIIEAIIQDSSGQGTISNMNALYTRLESQIPTEAPSQTQTQAQTQGDVVYSIPTAFRNFTFSHKEKTLDELVKDQWLYCSPTGDIGLGVKSFLDLRSWFRSTEVPVCEFCNETGIKVEFCPNEGCNVRVHQYCLIKKFSQRKASQTCPSCGNFWPCTLPKAEVLENWEESNDQTQAPAAADGSQRKRRRKSVDEPNNVGPSAADGSGRKKRRNHQSVNEPDNAGPSAADGLERKRRRNHNVDEPNHAGSSEPPNIKRQKKLTPDGSMNAGPSEVSEATSRRRSVRNASIHMR